MYDLRFDDSCDFVTLREGLAQPQTSSVHHNKMNVTSAFSP